MDFWGFFIENKLKSIIEIDLSKIAVLVDKNTGSHLWIEELDVSKQLKLLFQYWLSFRSAIEDNLHSNESMQLFQNGMWITDGMDICHMLSENSHLYSFEFNENAVLRDTITISALYVKSHNTYMNCINWQKELYNDHVAYKNIK